MPDPSHQTTQLLQLWINRMRAGDRTAHDELLRHFGKRLHRLTHKMLKHFPGVHRWELTDDVLQNALLRLIRALEDPKVQIASSRAFIGLASEQIRRELIDLARHYFGPEGEGANYASKPGGSSSRRSAPDPGDVSHEPSRLAEWTEFHQRAAELPGPEREAFDLLYYQGMTQAEAAEILQLSVRQVQRHWQRALLKLHGILRDGWQDK